MLSLANTYTLYFRLYISTMYLLNKLSINNKSKYPIAEIHRLYMPSLSRSRPW